MDGSRGIRAGSVHTTPGASALAIPTMLLSRARSRTHIHGFPNIAMFQGQVNKQRLGALQVAKTAVGWPPDCSGGAQFPGTARASEGISNARWPRRRVPGHLIGLGALQVAKTAGGWPPLCLARLSLALSVFLWKFIFLIYFESTRLFDLSSSALVFLTR